MDGSWTSPGKQMLSCMWRLELFHNNLRGEYSSLIRCSISFDSNTSMPGFSFQSRTPSFARKVIWCNDFFGIDIFEEHLAAQAPGSFFKGQHSRGLMELDSMVQQIRLQEWSKSNMMSEMTNEIPTGSALSAIVQIRKVLCCHCICAERMARR